METRWMRGLDLKKPLTPRQLEMAAKGVQQIYDDALNMEQALARFFYEEFGAEGLTTDTHGGRSTPWFEETGLAFATGVPTYCFVVAVTHPEVGMAASHRNTVTAGAVKSFIKRWWGNTKFQEQLLNLGDIEGLQKIVSIQALKSVVALATSEALNDFSHLTRSIPGRGTTISYSGIEYATSDQINELDSFIEEQVRAHPVFNDGSRQGLVRSVEFQRNLSEPMGVIYGGRRHRYSQPQFYQVSTLR